MFLTCPIKWFLLVAMFLIFQATAAYAQNGEFIIAQLNNDAPPLSIDERLGITQPEEEPNMTGDPLRDQAMRYYNGCTKSPHPFFNEETQKLHCGCISNEMLKIMEPENIMSVFDPSPETIDSRTIFYTQVHSKCIKYPIYEFMLNSCLANTSIKEKMPKFKEVCECSADTTARYLDSVALETLTAQLSITPETIDPLTDYIKGQEFEQISSAYMRRCVQIHVFGYR